MPKLSRSAGGIQTRAGEILRVLRRCYPEAVTALHHSNPFQLIVATILSAQCTDERVNQVTPVLFSRFPGPSELGNADPGEVEQIIRSTGFFRMKTRNILACSRALVERHRGEVPRSMEELVRLPGVGRKTANVVLGQAFGIASGVVVDTHVHRLSRRMGFTRSESAEGAEEDLMNIFPKRNWIAVGSVLILHGRKVCSARKPDCAGCLVAKLCPSAGTFT
jgi:endonuclease-3